MLRLGDLADLLPALPFLADQTSPGRPGKINEGAFARITVDLHAIGRDQGRGENPRTCSIG